MCSAQIIEHEFVAVFITYYTFDVGLIGFCMFTLGIILNNKVGFSFLGGGGCSSYCVISFQRSHSRRSHRIKPWYVIKACHNLNAYKEVFSKSNSMKKNKYVDQKNMSVTLPSVSRLGHNHLC